METIDQAQAALTQAQAAQQTLGADAAEDARQAAAQAVTEAQAALDRAKAPGPQATFTQADLDRIAAKARAEAKEAIRKENEQKRLQEQGEWKALHDQAQAEIATLTGKAELAERLAESANKSIDGEVKDWPKEVKGTDPGASDIAARLAWVETMRPLAKRLLVAAPADDLGARNGGAATPAQINEMTTAALVSTGRYGG